MCMSRLISSQSARKFLCLAALSIIIRPTAAVIWVLLCSWHLQNNKHQLYKTLKNYVIVGYVLLFFMLFNCYAMFGH